MNEYQNRIVYFDFLIIFPLARKVIRLSTCQCASAVSDRPGQGCCLSAESPASPLVPDSQRRPERGRVEQGFSEEQGLSV